MDSNVNHLINGYLDDVLTEREHGNLAAWIEAASERLEILAAGTIRAENVAGLIAATGTSQVHFRAPRNVHPKESGQSLGTQDSGGHEVTDADLVRAVREALN